jgi:hypothetical protein
VSILAFCDSEVTYCSSISPSIRWDWNQWHLMAICLEQSIIFGRLYIARDFAAWLSPHTKEMAN